MSHRKSMKRMVLVLLFTLALLVAPMTFLQKTQAQTGFSLFHLDFNHYKRVSFWGVPMDSLSGTPGWHVRAGIAHLLDKAEFVAVLHQGPVLVPSAMTIENPIPSDCPGGEWCSWNHVWSSDELAAADPLHTTLSLYNIAADTGGFAPQGSPDFCAAADHFLMAGIGTGEDPATCTLQGVNLHLRDRQIDFLIRSDSPPRRLLGTGLANSIESLMGGDYVNERLVDIIEAGDIVFGGGPKADWHLYTGAQGSVVSPPPTYLCNNYPINTFYNNPDYTSAVTPCIIFEGAHQAQVIFGQTLAAIPVWSQT